MTDERALQRSKTGLRDSFEPAVITAALTGGSVLPSESAAIPRGAKHIVAGAVAAAEAGAACVHLHGREDDGQPSARAELLAEIASGIRAQSNVVINFTTGGSPNMTDDQRLACVEAARPEIATLNVGTMNYELFPDPSHRPVTTAEWESEIFQAAGETIFKNTLGSVRRFAKHFRKMGVTPEVEAYDLGHIHMTRFLLDEGTLEPPILLQLVIGDALGGVGNSLEDLMAMAQTAQRLLGPYLGSLAVAATGYPMQFRVAAVALSWGMDCRVGLEDSLWVTRSQLAASNAELVEVAVGIANAVGRPIASPDDFRSSLGPWWGKTPTGRVLP